MSSVFKNDALHLAFCVVGVVGSLLLYGVLQVGMEWCQEVAPTQVSCGVGCSAPLPALSLHPHMLQQLAPSTVLVYASPTGTHHDDTIRRGPGCRGLQVQPVPGVLQQGGRSQHRSHHARGELARVGKQ